MKKTVLTLVIGIIIGSSLGLVAYGATQQTVEAIFMDIKYLLNGEVVEFENKPLVYNQTTYVPIREAANLLGLEVDWDQERQMVVLNSVDAPSNVEENPTKPNQEIKGDDKNLNKNTQANTETHLTINDGYEGFKELIQLEESISQNSSSFYILAYFPYEELDENQFFEYWNELPSDDKINYLELFTLELFTNYSSKPLSISFRFGTTIIADTFTTTGETVSVFLHN